MDELIVNQTEGTIECNFEVLKAQVLEVAERYRGLVVTEDTIAGAKKDRANLNKLKTRIDTVRKDAKSEYMKPYQEFETKVKELIAIVEEPMANIDTQLKEFEEQRIAEKEEHIKELYEANIGEFKDILPLEKVRNDKWTNATYSDQSIRYDISEMVQHIRSDFMVIESLKSEIESELKDVYVRSGFELSAAVRKNTDYLDAKRLAEEKLRKEEPKIEDIPFAKPDEFKFTVYGDDAKKVIDFMDFSEIRYERR